MLGNLRVTGVSYRQQLYSVQEEQQNEYNGSDPHKKKCAYI